MTRRAAGFGILLLFCAQTAYFARQTGAALFELRGQRATFRNDLATAWRLTQSALAWGGDRQRLEEHLVAILLMGFNQRDVGVRIDLPLEEDAAVEEARRLLQVRLTEAPHRANLWSYAADLSFHRAHVEHRARPIDLSALSEDPMQNLLPEDRLGVAALEKAASIEPNNYLYEELLTEKFLEYGTEPEAVRSCRAAVAAYPKLDGHTYLARFDLPPAVVNGAVAGFEDSLRAPSLVARVEILRDAGRLLARYNRDEEVLPYLVDACRLDPLYYDARIDLAMTRIRLSQWSEAEQDLKAAAALAPEDPYPHYSLAMVRRQAHDDEGAIEELRRARALGASETKVFVALGESFETLGRTKEAENMFLAATNIHPNDVNAWSAYYSFARRHDDRRGAAKACERLATLKDVDERMRQHCLEFPAGGA